MSETERNHDVGRRPSAASPSSNAVRALLRLWLGVPDMRPVHPHIRSGGIEAVPGRTPSYDWTKLTKNRN